MIYKKLIISVFIIIGVIFTFRYEDVFAYNSYTNGQKIKFRSSNYYVIGDSDENSDYVFLLRKKHLIIMNYFCIQMVKIFK